MTNFLPFQFYKKRKKYVVYEIFVYQSIHTDSFKLLAIRGLKYMCVAVIFKLHSFTLFFFSFVATEQEFYLTFQFLSSIAIYLLFSAAAVEFRFFYANFFCLMLNFLLNLYVKFIYLLFLDFCCISVYCGWSFDDDI